VLAALVLAVLPGPAGCRPQAAAPPPLGEALLVIDTDLPVPALAARLRVDLFTTGGTWYAARDLALPNASDWPASFAVALVGGEAAKDVVVRLRAYPEAKVEDYRGYLFADRPAVCNDATCATASPHACCPLVVPQAPAPTNAPRLTVDGGADVTPSTEPLPALAVDRLVLLHVQPGVAGQASILLAGACAGTMADLRDFTILASCVDTEGARVAVGATALAPVSPTAAASMQGTFARTYATPCTTPARPASSWNGTPLHDDELCLPGGPFVFGARDGALGDPRDAVPERVAVLPSFLLDRYEVTVGRFRKAVAGGFTGGGSQPSLNDGPLGASTVDPNDVSLCTWSTAPLGREEFPVNCVTQQTARAFCVFDGGDLPTEAEWEYAASVAGRGHKTHFPWGDGTALPPSCSDVVYNRRQVASSASLPACPLYGPSAVTFADHDGGDVTPGPGPGVVDLGGNVNEWAIDTFAGLGANCWLAAPQTSPACTAPPSAAGPPIIPADSSSLRGGFWEALPNNLLAVSRDARLGEQISTDTGFRCARPGGA